MQLKAAPTHPMSDHEQNLHRDQLNELQRTAARCSHELDAAKAEVDRLKRLCVRQQLEGPRLDAHRQLTGNILDAMRALKDAFIADQRFRAQLLQDRLLFRLPLESIRPYDAGGERWADELLPVVEGWIAKVERRDAYGISTKPATSPKRAAPQPVRV